MAKAGTKQATDLSHIVEQLRPLAVEISKLSFDKENARLHSERNLKAIERSLSEYGQRAPIVVQRDGMIVRAGNGRLQAAINLGWTHIAAVVTDDAEQTAKAFALMDNKSAELAEWDVEKLSALLSEIDQSDLSIDLTGFDSIEFDAISAGEYKQTSEDDSASDEETETIQPKERTFSIFSREIVIKEAFDYYRRTGFPYPRVERHEAMQRLNALFDADDDILLKSNACGSVADSYHSHRFHAAATRMRSPVESFNIDKSLLKCVTKDLEAGHVGSGKLSFMDIVSGTQACANFRPAFALWIYRQFGADGGTLLDTSTGYGGRLTGFLASKMSHYIGIDPNVDTYNANKRLAADLGQHKKTTLINLPAEDVTRSQIKDETCDLAFTSPPYFAKEIYSHDDTQSWKRYQTYQEWCDCFLTKMLSLQYRALKPGSYSVVNISDVTLGKNTYPLERETVNTALALGFDHVKTLSYPLSSGPQNLGKERSEPVFVFRKLES